MPAELGGTGPAFNAGLWAEPVIHTAMKEAEVAAAAVKKEKKLTQDVDVNTCVQEPTNFQEQLEQLEKDEEESNTLTDMDKTSLNDAGSNPTKCHSGKTIRTDVELNVINQEETTGSVEKLDEDNKRFIHVERICNGNIDVIHSSDDKMNQSKRNSNDLTFLDVEVTSNEFEIIPSRSDGESSKDNSLDNRLEGKALISGINSETPSEETNLIT